MLGDVANYKQKDSVISTIAGAKDKWAAKILMRQHMVTTDSIHSGYNVQCNLPEEVIYEVHHEVKFAALGKPEMPKLVWHQPM